MPAGRQQPVFSSGVALLTVEAAVFDSDGRPVPNLAAADFTARVDGKPRRVVFARFSGGKRSEAAAATGADNAPLPAHHVSNTSPAATGRIVIFAVDQQTIRPGEGKILIGTASRLLGSLSPADAVGLFGIPALRVELTRDHARIREALNRVAGTRPSTPWKHLVTLEEAAAIERGDRITLQTVLERECRPEGRPEPLRAICPPEVRDQARDMVNLSHAQVLTTITALGNLVDRLKTLRGSKHLVLISGGIPFDQSSLSYYQDFARKAAEAQVVVYAIHLDQMDLDATDRRPIETPYGGRSMTQGLSTLASVTGGGFYMGVGTAAGVFDRIETELDNFYELGIESTPADADGKTHKLDVTVNRQGAEVRSRREVIRPPGAARAADTLIDVLHQPVDVSELRLAVSAYSMHGDDPAKVKLLIAAEIGGSTGPRAPVDWGFIVSQDNKVIADGRQRAAEGGPAGPIVATTNAQLAPGRYRLRFAAIDADGRAGSVEWPLEVGLRAASGLRISDLVIGSASGNRMQPRARVSRGSDLIVLAEVAAEDAQQLEGADVAFGLSSAGTNQLVASGVMPLRGASSTTVRAGQSTIETSALAPGAYIVIGVVRVGGKAVDTLSRVIEIVR